MKTQFLLFKTRRFFPLFIVQFFGAFNDNVFKNALVIMLSYRLAEQLGLNPELIVSLAAGLFILPFFLFSGTAGKLADKHEKSRLVQLIKLAEVILMLGACLGFVLESLALLMAVLFGLGTQSSFFGPIKYGILPEQLKEDELISGNALISSGTFLSILLGTLVGGLLILTENGIWVISGITILSSLIGLGASLIIPKTTPQDPSLKVSFNIIKDTLMILTELGQGRRVFLSIIGISWFWFLGATLLAQFPMYTKMVVGGNEEIVTLFLVVFSIGIWLGSLLCNRLLKGMVHAQYVPIAAFCISIVGLDLYWVSSSIVPAAPLIGFSQFFQTPTQWRLVVDLTIIAMAGGVYIVPLYAILQKEATSNRKSRTIAANNVMNALCMVVSAVFCMTMFTYDYLVLDIFLVLFLVNAVMGVYIYARR